MFKIRKNGEIISEREWLLQNQNKEARAHMKDLLAQAVVHKGRVKFLGYIVNQNLFFEILPNQDLNLTETFKLWKSKEIDKLTFEINLK